MSFAHAFAPLRTHVGKAVFLRLNEGVAGLGAGSHPITIFDWSAMDEEARAIFAESQLDALTRAGGKGWSARVTPFALVNGESHPVRRTSSISSVMACCSST